MRRLLIITTLLTTTLTAVTPDCMELDVACQMAIKKQDNYIAGLEQALKDSQTDTKKCIDSKKECVDSPSILPPFLLGLIGGLVAGGMLAK